jgi:hypothetical protein
MRSASPALDELEDKREYAVTLFETVDGRDVRMVQRGEDLGLALKPPQALRIPRKRFRQEFQRDIALQPGVARAVDLAHAAFANLGSDFVGTEPVACSQSHGKRPQS